MNPSATLDLAFEMMVAFSALRSHSGHRTEADFIALGASMPPCVILDTNVVFQR
jgi:hypothetical protein